MLFLIEDTTTAISIQNLNEEYLKGFKVLRKLRIDSNVWRRLQLLFLSNNTYLEAGINQCEFKPGFGIKIQSDQDSSQIKTTYLLLSQNCEKVYISNSLIFFRDKFENYRELSKSSLENIIHLIIFFAIHSKNFLLIFRIYMLLMS